MSGPLDAAVGAALELPTPRTALDAVGLVAPSDEAPGTYLEALAQMPSPLLGHRNLLIFHLPLAFEAAGLPHAAWVLAEWLFGGPPPYPLAARPARRNSAYFR